MTDDEGKGGDADRTDKPNKLDNVIVFPSLREMKESGGPVSRGPRNYAACQHDHGVTVHETDRAVVCKKCSKNVDAFDALLSLATHWDWQRTRDAMKAAHLEADKVGKELQLLKDARARARNSGHLSVHRVKAAFEAVVKTLQRNRDARTRGKADDGAADAYTYAINTIRHVRGQLLDPGDDGT